MTKPHRVAKIQQSEEYLVCDPTNITPKFQHRTKLGGQCAD